MARQRNQHRPKPQAKTESDNYSSNPPASIVQIRDTCIALATMGGLFLTAYTLIHVFWLKVVFLVASLLIVAAIYLIWRNRIAAVICIISAALFIGLNLFLLSPAQPQNDSASKTADQDTTAKSILPQDPAPKPIEGKNNTNQPPIEPPTPRMRKITSGVRQDATPIKSSENRLSNFHILQQGESYAEMEVTYFYNGGAGKEYIHLSIEPLGKDGNSSGGTQRDIKIIGSEAIMRATYSINPPPGVKVTTYQMEFCMVLDTEPFYCRRFPFVKTWSYNPPPK